ncbi:MAG: aquaporin [Bacteroidota bacterium]|nr:aquaporin [Bacteroidota bacterium]
MRAMPIRVRSGHGGLIQMKASFRKNWLHYLQEALGLAIFMVSACSFAVILESKMSFVHLALPDEFLRRVLMGIVMGLTALFIFYGPWTSPSGSHINPAVTLSFLYLDRICPWDAVFYILAQFIGGVLAVLLMQWIIGAALTDLPVSSVVTVPGKTGLWPAFFTELFIAFGTMTMVLFTSDHRVLKKCTRPAAGILVALYVIIAGPISGFGMNPARSFASAVPAHTYTAFWMYMMAPVLGMLAATMLYSRIRPVQQMVKNKENIGL